MVHKLSITNNIGEMAQLEGFIDGVAEDFGIAPDVAFQLNLALDEALANSVNYAYDDGVTGVIELEASVRDGAIVFRLIDEGRPFDPTKGGEDVDTTSGAEERAIGGLGIFLIKQMMDKVSYSREGNRNVLTMIKSPLATEGGIQ